MIELLEEFGLDSESVSAVAQAREGLGTGHFFQFRESEGQRETALLAALTHWRVAGGLWLLLDKISSARNAFGRVADQLTEIGHPYGILMRSLSEPERQVTWRDAMWLRLDDGQSTLIGAHVFLLMHPLALRGGDDLGQAIRLRERLQPLASLRVGRLGLPVQSYLDLYDTVSAGADVRVSGLSNALAPFVTTYGRALSEAMEDTFHWTRLMSAVHPVEPEVAAVVSATAKGFDERSPEFTSEAINAVPTTALSQNVLTAVLEFA